MACIARAESTEILSALHAHECMHVGNRYLACMPKAHNTIATTPQLTYTGNLTIIEPRSCIMAPNV